MRTRRRWAVAVATSLGTIVLVVALGLPIYVFPPQIQTESADLIYVIGPPTTERLRAAEKLRERGVADRILISVPLEGEQSAESQSICFKNHVDCLHPEPFTTAGEAIMLNEYASGQHVVVLTFTPHVARTRFIFASCFDGETVVEAVAASLNLLEWGYQYGYQTLAFVKAWLTPCE